MCSTNELLKVLYAWYSQLYGVVSSLTLQCVDHSPCNNVIMSIPVHPWLLNPNVSHSITCHADWNYYYYYYNVGCLKAMNMKVRVIFTLYFKTIQTSSFDSVTTIVVISLSTALRTNSDPLYL